MTTPKRHYKDEQAYARKLQRIAERLGLSDLQYDWGRQSGYVAFAYQGVQYRFEHTVAKSKTGRAPLHYGTDCLCRVVLGLEALARLADDGLYDFRQLIEGFRALPAGEPVKSAPPLPECFRAMGFTEWPADAEAVKRRYKLLVRDTHPDAGGSNGAWLALQAAYEQGLAHFSQAKEGGS